MLSSFDRPISKIIRHLQCRMLLSGSQNTNLGGLNTTHEDQEHINNWDPITRVLVFITCLILEVIANYIVDTIPLIPLRVIVGAICIVVFICGMLSAISGNIKWLRARGTFRIWLFTAILAFSVVDSIHSEIKCCNNINRLLCLIHWVLLILILVSIPGIRNRSRNSSSSEALQR